MNPLLSSPRFAYHRSPPSTDDIEMLQTDVMRFFAILCLCLMAIFALVKALPMSPPADRPTIATPRDSSAKAAVLEKKIAALKEKLAGLQARLAEATEALKNVEAQAADATVRAQQTVSRLARKRAELAAVSQTLKAAQDAIETREGVLAGIVREIREKRRVRDELDAQIEIEEQQYQEIQARLDRAADRLSRAAPPRQPAPIETPPAPAPTPPAKKGFTLRFASDSALDTLINRRVVQFYALAGQKAWQLNTAKGQPVYTAAPMPAQIYEMAASTVPASYTARFSRQVAAFGSGRVTWGVTLPENTAQAISRLIANREGGDLTIMPSGEVILK
ncbi:MAG: hypothetical protein QNJ01_07480 [Desulfobacterales bacterium]|nr:hypothetical protein [Desulfobacterales bacterium]